MADDEQFSLCWNNFNTNLSAGFHESLCRGDLVDVTLAAEGQFVKAHRLVLSVCSPYFRKMFTQMPANQHAFVFLKDVSHTALKDLIQFMYCGEVNVKQEALPAFISTAEALQIKGLTDGDPPASQSPAAPSTPVPQPIASPRIRQRTQTQRATYKIDSLDENVEKISQPTQIVIQTTSSAAPQATMTQQTQHLQTINQQQHVAAPIVSTGTTTTTVVTHKRQAQRGSVGAGSHIKRRKSTIDPLEMSDMGGTGTSSGSNVATQQITVQTAVVPASESKSQHTSDAEYIDLPMEISTKAEPDYSEEAGDVDGADNDGTAYVEDDSYGDVRYEENYFTENEDGPTTATVAVTSGAATGGVTTATTSKTIIKQQQSFSDSSYVETDQGNSEAQGSLLVRKRRGRPKIKEENVYQPKLIDKLINATQRSAGVPAVYASTTKGGMKLVFDGHHFRYSYRKGQYSIFQCCYKENKEECKVKVVSDQKRVYPLEGEHVHFVQATDKSVTEITFEPAEPDEDYDNKLAMSGAQKLETIEYNDDTEENNVKPYEIFEQKYLKAAEESSETIIPTASVETSHNTIDVANEADNGGDPNDFREKIKKRLQKALLGKKKI